MLGLFKFQLKPVHDIPEGNTFNWEGFLNRIYKSLTKECNPFLAIASNTEKGKPTGHIIFRMRENIDEINHKNMLSINSVIFDAFFSQYTKQNIFDHSDFYHLDKKRKHIEMDCSVYPLRNGPMNKALIIFDYPLDEKLIDGICQKISKILDS